MESRVSRLKSRLVQIFISIRPTQPLLLCQVLSVTAYTLAFHPRATHLDDFSDVSGFFGPGAFWAWILLCITSIAPTEGYMLYRRIWHENPKEKEEAEEEINVSALESPFNLWSFRHELLYFHDDAGPSDEFDDAKLMLIPQILESLFEYLQHTTPGQIPVSLENFGFKLAGDLSRHLHTQADTLQDPPLNNFLDQQSDQKKLFRLGLMAQTMLDLLPFVTTKASSLNPGFTCYGIFYDSQSHLPRDFLIQRNPLIEDLFTVFPWLEQSAVDFPWYLMEFRNRVMFFHYQQKKVEPQIPDNLDPNTFAVVAYAAVACGTALLRNSAIKCLPWEALDETAAGVAQIAYGLSAVAIISERPENRRLSARMMTWLVLYFSSLWAIKGRVLYHDQPLSFSGWLMCLQMLGFTNFVIFHGNLFSLYAIYTDITRLLSRKWPRYFTARNPPNLPPWRPSDYMMMGTSLIFLGVYFLQMVASNDQAQLEERKRPFYPWQAQFGFPIPRSSAKLSDLNQAAALGTAVLLFLNRPIQKVLHICASAVVFLFFCIALPPSLIIWWLGGLLRRPYRYTVNALKQGLAYFPHE